MSQRESSGMHYALTEDDEQLVNLIHEMSTAGDSSIRNSKAEQLKVFQESPVDYVKKLTAMICLPSLLDKKKHSLAIHVKSLTKDKNDAVEEALRQIRLNNKVECRAISACEHDLQ